MKKNDLIQKKTSIKNWSSLQLLYQKLIDRPLNSLAELKKWFSDVNLLSAVVEEEAGWRYIHMTCDTTNIAYQQAYQEYVQKILPKWIVCQHHLNEKAMQCIYIDQLYKEKGYDMVIRNIASDLKIYQSKNVDITAKLQLSAQKYSTIVGAMSIDIDGKTYTLQKATAYLESADRVLRKKVYEKIGQCRLQEKEKLNTLFTSMIADRHQMAINAEFENFRDYIFVAMHRFDYTPQDCYQFHQAIAEEVVPLLNVIALERKQKLQLTKLKPWDKYAAINGIPLKPFNSEQDLIQKTIRVFDQLDLFFGNCLRTMQAKGHLNLTAKQGKAPGGYNYSLPQTGIPFIFMHATATLDDMVTLIHEGGHAVHSFLMNDLPLNCFKHPSLEVAELASMSMELISMDYWHIFFENEEETKRAKKQHLTRVITVLAWAVVIDKFQHWLYENFNHNVQERIVQWKIIFNEFSDTITDWTGQEAIKENLWQQQLHLFEVPFYYIEYAIAQLGAIAIWKNYQNNPVKTLHQYKQALKLGYTESISNIYNAAGISFDFSRDYIKENVTFLKRMYNLL